MQNATTRDVLSSRYLIVEARFFYANGLKNYIVSNYSQTTVDVADDLHSALQFLNSYFYDFIVIELEDNFDFHVIDYIRKKRMNGKIIVFSSNYKVFQLDQLIQRNVDAILLKKEKSCVFDDSILNTLNNEKFYSHTLLNQIAEISNLNEEIKLTTTEKLIMQQLSLGKSAANVAAHYQLSVNTVNTHKKNIFKKFKVHNVAELIAQLHQSAWVN